MAQTKEDLAQRIRSLETELDSALRERERACHQNGDQGDPKFDQEDVSEQAKFREGLGAYLRNARYIAALTVPMLYVAVVLFVVLDLYVRLYQIIAFPIYGVPKVKRADYFIYDRGRLKYLNVLERLNCDYCSYINGFCGYLTEIAARTEQYWCPVKHARRPRAPHSRYPHFLEYGDARQYRQEIDKARKDFVDLRTLTGNRPGVNSK